MWTPLSRRPAHRRPRDAARRKRLGLALSLGCHSAFLAALIWLRPAPPRTPEPKPLVVALVDAPAQRPAQAQAQPAAPAAAPAAAVEARPPPRPLRRPSAPVPAPFDAAPINDAVALGPDLTLSEGEVAGATTVGGGGGADSGGGECDMLRGLQAALRKDALVQAAVAPIASAAGRALMVWNGDWVARPGQDGKGLAAVREAVMWEIAFAPKPCRARPMRGLVVVSLDDGPRPARLAFGTGAWRWSDLLTPTVPLPGSR